MNLITLIILAEEAVAKDAPTNDAQDTPADEAAPVEGAASGEEKEGHLDEAANLSCSCCSCPMIRPPSL